MVGPKLISGMFPRELDGVNTGSPTVLSTPARGRSIESWVSLDFLVLA